jgi:hypothetical protein
MWNKLIKKIHIYLGLLSFTQFLIFGIAGLIATFRHSERVLPAVSIQVIEFAAPPAQSDREVAMAVYDILKPHSVSSTPKDWPLRRDPQNNLRIEFHSANGVKRVTVLEKEGRLRIENERIDTWSFINRLHAVAFEYVRTSSNRMWAVYNEFAMFSLIAMSLSGIFLWLSSRPGFVWARAFFVAGAGSFAVLYFLVR